MKQILSILLIVLFSVLFIIPVSASSEIYYQDSSENQNIGTFVFEDNVEKNNDSLYHISVPGYPIQFLIGSMVISLVAFSWIFKYLYKEME